MMDESQLYHALILLVVGLSIVLVIFSAATGGRKLADRDVMRLQGVNGVRAIEIRIKLRMAANRLILGLMFGLIGTLVLIDETASWRGWVSRIGLVSVLALFSVSSVIDWLDDGKQLRLVVTDAEKRMDAIEKTALDHAGQQGVIHPLDHPDRHTEESA
jgi:hypothetical protein